MTIGLVGAGNMARALARGWGEPVLCTDNGSGRARALAEELGGEALASNAELAERAELVVLCHKPAQLEAVAAALTPTPGRVVSLLGGVSLERLHAALGGAAIVRAMPNTAVEVRQGVSCLCARDEDATLLAAVRALFERVGTVVEVAERLMEVATATAGVAPAYVSLIAEAQIDAAVRHGMPSALAAELVVEGVAGSAALLRARRFDTLGVRREVASPGGLTARGLDALERGGVRSAFMDAMKAVVGAGGR